jgi:Right handed beta helix region
VGHIEIDHVAVLRVTDAKETRGILIHPAPGDTVVGLYVHHNYVANTQAEAIYLGTEPHGLPFPELAKLRSVEVSYNRIENIGFDGIKIKVAVADVFVHHNVITNVGMSRTKAHQGGIKVASSVGHFFNNTVVGAVEGIRMGRPLPGPQTHYYNNLVVDVIDVGIDAPEPGAWVYHNTVVNSQGVGIKATGADSLVENNIIAGAGEPLKVREAVVSSNLLALAASEVGFADMSNGDYRLTAVSPAVDVVPVSAALSCDVELTMFPKSAQTPAWPLADREDHSRPAGCKVDLGAFEFGSSINGASRSRR